MISFLLLWLLFSVPVALLAGASIDAFSDD